jgi:hypothetical protein
MKSSPLSIAIVFAALVAGYLMGSGSGERPANAQGAAAPGGGRYQVSSWGSHGSHGCYIIDTATGALWKHEYEPHGVKKVADKLP